MASLVHEVSIDLLKDSFVDLSSASPCRYRLIDCKQLIRRRVLRITDYTTFPNVRYCALSYVWRGVAASGDSQEEFGTFAVKGAEDGDPVSIDVLMHASVAATKEGSTHLWLDRLCILQTNDEDKAWQISRMYDIYRRCNTCLVLPGGLRRLVSLDEETTWIHRAWTLQEATAPDCTKVLFTWSAGSGWFYGQSRGDLDEVIPGKSGLADLEDLLRPYLGGQSGGELGGQTFFTTEEDKPEHRILIQPAIFGCYDSPAHVFALMGVLYARDTDANAPAVWRSALMRTSSRPVDMIFSIMGLFDVSLDPRAFKKNDREGATIALAREILRKGGAPSWLGVSFSMPISRRLSTFPEFPITKIDGTARVYTAEGEKEVTELVSDEFLASWSIKEGIAMASMDELGYLTFTSKAVRLLPYRETSYGKDKAVCHCDTTRRVFTKALNGTVWEIAASRPAVLDTHFIAAMLVEEHAPGRYHRSSNFALCHCIEKVIKSTWKGRSFTIGGPDTFPVESL
ncbi:hypothetical protein CERSUDRAFT_142503 [Gelatoporia subvermispora B]|uniref:Heterokaryon incompatibility domain-containing protein n=1 Tax=Ceriporiopsis subvermispora (strain B) TaxID=914234 RepID=M2R5S8_CERS8|nr:hypothetical protein CERSUDRAFT_142503 [Gelatoporia subvermispora B]